jgi:Pyruvate/2-oxoacid:ferredoxin oxidoreductase gamma subunit
VTTSTGTTAKLHSTKGGSASGGHEALGRHEGWCLLSAQEAMLKGVLEAELDVELLAIPSHGVFERVLRLNSDAGAAQILREHGVRLDATDDAARAVDLALLATSEGHRTVAFAPNSMLESTMAALLRATAAPLAADGAMAIVLEDDPATCPASCPRQAAVRLNIPCLEPADLEQLRDGMEFAMRLSKAGSSPVAIVVHRDLLDSSDTLRMRPNRVMSRLDAALQARRRRRTPRWGEAGSVMRIARRLELNAGKSIPSPGERVPVGFITVGPARPALDHVIHVMRLVGRVPVLSLAMLHPLDEAAIERLLGRCEQVVVLEPRPGAVEATVLTVAESMRYKGEIAATVWGRRLPPSAQHGPMLMGAGDALHPSTLARRVVHLLHRIRPTLDVASHLQRDLPAPGAASLPPRGAGLGYGAAVQRLRAIMTELTPRLSDPNALEQHDAEPTSLLVQGRERFGASKRTIPVEIWNADRLHDEGIAAIRQAARDEQPRIVVVLIVSDELPVDVERIVAAAVPSDRAARSRVRSAGLGDTEELSDILVEAAFAEGFTAIVVPDAPVARFSPSAIERSLRDADRLGFSPVQTASWPAEQVCDLRPLDTVASQQKSEQRELQLRRSRLLIEPLKSEDREGGPIRILPLLEHVEVVRSKSPMIAPKLLAATRLTAPPPIHARASQWRCHIAGWRGEAPGVMPRALALAGRRMGYHVRVVHEPVPCSAGWRAFSQVLFTRLTDNEDPLPLTGTIPYAEADVLIGVDPAEALRAIETDDRLLIAQRDRTFAVVNSGRISGAVAAETSRRLAEQLETSLAQHTRPDHRIATDVASIARAILHTDRVVDLMLLGAAFQEGMIPVSIDAMEAALREIESLGVGRSLEVFRLGRVLATERALLDKSASGRADDRDPEPVKQIVRRMALTLRSSKPGGAQNARRFARLMERLLTATPGLAETEPGREARRDAVHAVYQCFFWGGMSYAEQFVDRIIRLYDADRGDRGRMLTRLVVLPLAEAMLIRDHLHIAAMATAIEHRRQIRQRMNIKPTRGDRVERRYVTRVELQVFGRRITADVRTSDWPARLMSRVSRLVPLSFRGTSEQRGLRQAMYDLLDKVVEAADKDYDRYAEILRHVHHQALNRTLSQDVVTAAMESQPEELRRDVDAKQPETARTTASAAAAKGDKAASV